MWQMVLYVYIAFPGVMAVLDGHDVHLTTTEFRVYLEGFQSQQDCLNYQIPTNLPAMTFTDAIGNQYPIHVNQTKPIACIRQI